MRSFPKSQCLLSDAALIIKREPLSWMEKKLSSKFGILQVKRGSEQLHLVKFLKESRFQAPSRLLLLPAFVLLFCQ